jgi:uroporphyrinogen-III synthase
MHILITRPEPDAGLWRDELRARGIAVTVDPLLDIVLAPPDALDTAGVQALIVTSRNAVRWLAAHPGRDGLRHLTVYAVGPGSSGDVRALGFGDVRQGAATARDLVPVIAAAAPPAAGRLVHLSGDKVAVDMGAALAQAGLAVERRVVYRSVPADRLRPETIAGLAAGTIDTVALLSPVTAATFVRLATAAGLRRRLPGLAYVCLSGRIAAALDGVGGPSVHVADTPDADAVRRLVEKLAAAAP